MFRNRTLLSAVVLALTFAVGACDRQEGPAEEAGEEIDKAVEEVGEAAERAGDEMEEAAEDVEEKTDDGGG